MAGEANHSRRIGAAAASAAGLHATSQSAAAMAVTGAIHIARPEETLVRSGARSTAFHSSSRVRVKSIRPVVRTIASRLKNAS